MTKTKQFFCKKEVVLGSGILFVLFMLVVLPWMSHLMDSVTTSTLSPDTFFSFDVTKYYVMVNEYGEIGRRTYILQRWTFDVAWPLVYGVFLTSVILFMTKEKEYKIPLFLLPVIGVGLDFIENTLATITMSVYPTELHFVFYILAIVSTLKWITIAVSFGVIIYLIAKKFKR